MFCRLLFSCLLILPLAASAAGVVYEGTEGLGKGKHVVLVAGDEEYRSEEALPQLGQILAKHHGFKCTVLFPIAEDGTINPDVSNIPGLEALETADLMIVGLRFRDLPDDQMKYMAEYIESGKPIIGLRTSTHAFNIPKGKTYEKYSFNFGGQDYTKGFGRQVLGETWVNHHGKHGSQATRGIFAKGQESHPILMGIADGQIFGPTDVYTVNLPLPGDSVPLVLGQVVDGMKEEDKALEGPKNDPMMPVAWTKTYTTSSGKKARVFTTTMGASQDLLNEGVRRMIVNASFWALGLEGKIPDKTVVDIVGDYKPTRFSFKGYTKGVKPEDHAWKK
ncbi:Trehalose utilization [Anatilimnocola aggregata]|uniref:Trehalose utilization n=1 Tax=Anatilimnocola aggregata TaxID=2528021 RepID=A0A517Y717_9BACT|nr:ThuA domain-containing protein [Anatilimnocola aggregata]QDU26015.1 Trehalose utilization [Anatilimnocola aggregata]